MSQKYTLKEKSCIYRKFSLTGCVLYWNCQQSEEATLPRSQICHPLNPVLRNKGETVFSHLLFGGRECQTSLSKKLPKGGVGVVFWSWNSCCSSLLLLANVVLCCLQSSIAELLCWQL